MLKNKWSRGAIGVAAALALGLSVASPANAVLGTPNADFQSSTVAPGTTSWKTIPGTVKFSGTVNPNYSYFNFNTDYSVPKPTIVGRNKGVKAANVNRPSLDTASSAMTPGVKNSIGLTVYRYTTPGKYRINVPVSERAYGSWTGTKTDKTEYITIRGNAKTSRSMTSFSGYSNSNRTFSMYVNAPDYQSGAKVRVVYKAKGASSYKTVALSKLKVSSYNSKTSFRVAAKYNLRPGGKIVVKFGKVGFSPAYQTAAANIKSY